MKTFWRYSLAGLLILVPTWGTLLILSTLVSAVNEQVEELWGDLEISEATDLGLLLFLLLILVTGVAATHVLGRRLFVRTERWIESIPLVRSVYATLRGMTDLFQFRSRFGRSTVVAFPFPRDGLWALGFVMGIAPPAVQAAPSVKLMMVFVPTAIHPFTGYLAFIPERQLRPLSLLPEDAMKMEFSAGFYKPSTGWLSAPKAAI